MFGKIFLWEIQENLSMFCHVLNRTTVVIAHLKNLDLYWSLFFVTMGSMKQFFNRNYKIHNTNSDGSTNRTKRTDKRLNLLRLLERPTTNSN